MRFAEVLFIKKEGKRDFAVKIRDTVTFSNLSIVIEYPSRVGSIVIKDLWRRIVVGLL